MVFMALCISSFTAKIDNLRQDFHCYVTVYVIKCRYAVYKSHEIKRVGAFDKLELGKCQTIVTDYPFPQCL